MSGVNNLYENTAFLYDFDNRQLLTDDINFCLRYVGETKGDILELACGTGRMTFPILENIAGTGRKLLAFDLSDSMLDVLRSKLNGRKDAPDSLRVEKADMSRFSFHEKFGLVICMWRSFQQLTNPADAENCLRCIHNHMTGDAVLLLNVFLPQKSYGGDWAGKESVTYDIADEKNGVRIKRFTKNVCADEENQIINYLTTYDVTLRNGSKERYEDKIFYKYYYPNQIKELLLNAGFKLIDELYSLNENNKDITDQYYVLGK